MEILVSVNQSLLGPLRPILAPPPIRTPLLGLRLWDSAVSQIWCLSQPQTAFVKRAVIAQLDQPFEPAPCVTTQLLLLRGRGESRLKDRSRELRAQCSACR